jgi:hypothetical protein
MIKPEGNLSQRSMLTKIFQVRLGIAHIFLNIKKKEV